MVWSLRRSAGLHRHVIPSHTVPLPALIVVLYWNTIVKLPHCICTSIVSHDVFTHNTCVCCVHVERPANSFTPSCQNHGVYNTTAMTCQCDDMYSGFQCQFKGLSQLSVVEMRSIILRRGRGAVSPRMGGTHAQSKALEARWDRCKSFFLRLECCKMYRFAYTFFKNFIGVTLIRTPCGRRWPVSNSSPTWPFFVYACR